MCRTNTAAIRGVWIFTNLITEKSSSRINRRAGASPAANASHFHTVLLLGGYSKSSIPLYSCVLRRRWVSRRTSKSTLPAKANTLIIRLRRDQPSAAKEGPAAGVGLVSILSVGVGGVPISVGVSSVFSTGATGVDDEEATELTTVETTTGGGRVLVGAAEAELTLVMGAGLLEGPASPLEEDVPPPFALDEVGLPEDDELVIVEEELPLCDRAAHWAVSVMLCAGMVWVVKFQSALSWAFQPLNVYAVRVGGVGSGSNAPYAACFTLSYPVPSLYTKVAM